MKYSIGEVLQNLYDSEINIRISWMWDGGVDWAILTGYANDIIVEDGNEESIESAIVGVAEAACRLYPGSLFEKWYVPAGYAACPEFKAAKEAK